MQTGKQRPAQVLERGQGGHQLRAGILPQAQRQLSRRVPDLQQLHRQIEQPFGLRAVSQDAGRVRQVRVRKDGHRTTRARVLLQSSRLHGQPAQAGGRRATGVQ